MKPPPFDYMRPDDLEAVLDVLVEHGDEAKVLAGGQSLVPLLNFRFATPSVLVDLAAVDSLRRIERRDARIAIAAMTSQRAVEMSPEVREACPIIPEALRHVGHLQIRHRGTIGGSIAHADPAAELPAVALALGAEIIVRKRDSERTVPASEFFLGPFTTALEPDELVTEVRFEIPPPGSRSAFMELARRSGDFALAGVAAVNRFPGEGDVALAAFGVGGAPMRLTVSEEVVRGRMLTEEVAREAGAAASEAVRPPTDVHADSEYRKKLLGVLVRRALLQVA